MHTASISHVRSAVRDYFDDNEDPEWFWKNDNQPSRQPLDPHLMEHERRALELMDDDDEDAAIIHRLLGENMLRAARESR